MFNHRIAQNKKATWWMLFAVVLYSFLPLFFHVGDAGAAIFLFNAVFQMSAVFTSLAILIIRYLKHPLFCAQSITVSVANLRRYEIWWACVGVFGYIVFAWSLKYVDISVAAILYETWPIYVILLTSYLFKGENRKDKNRFDKERYQKTKISTWLLIFVSLCGLALVTLSQTEKSEESFISVIGDTPIRGILAVLIAALIGGLLAPFSLRWGNQVSKEATRTGEVNQEMFFVIIAMMIVRFFGCIVATLLGFIWNESLTTNGFAAALICGVFVSSAGIIFRYANALTNNLGINALVYATPVFSLAWLATCGFVNVPQPDYLIIGGIAIIIANVLINYEADVRAGYKALVVSLWASGMIVYFRGAGVEFNEYYNAIMVVATIFILILSFRTDRMIRRATAEDELFFSLWRLIPNLVKGEKQTKYAHAALLSLATATSPSQLNTAYSRIRIFIGSDSAVANVAKQVDMLAHSKQQGRNFAEIIALGILAVVIVWGLLVFTPSDTAGHVGFYANVSSFLLATTVIFLFFNVCDLQKDRYQAIMLDNGKIHFRGAEDRWFERVLSIITCAAVILIYGLLFWYY